MHALYIAYFLHLRLCNRDGVGLIVHNWDLVGRSGTPQFPRIVPLQQILTGSSEAPLVG